jgi:hypothetical protein
MIEGARWSIGTIEDAQVSLHYNLDFIAGGELGHVVFADKMQLERVAAGRNARQCPA